MKRILALTLAVLMLAMCFVACGKTETPETPDTDNTNNETSGDQTGPEDRPYDHAKAS